MLRTTGFLLFKAGRRLLLRAERGASPQVAAKIRFQVKDPAYFFPFGTAMNGQTSRLEMTRQVLHACGIRQIVETGTFRGTTTEWFAQFEMPVLTIEADPQSYEFAKLRLKSREQIRQELGNSVDRLKAAVETLDLAVPTFFYLDAHWHEYLPLRDELDVILRHFINPVILIDDFQVPDDPLYTFDDYGPGKALTPEYLEESWRDGLTAFYPATPAREETGRRRGCIFLTANPRMAASLGALPLLRPASIGSGDLAHSSAQQQDAAY